jgi:hypothetical protein
MARFRGGTHPVSVPTALGRTDRYCAGSTVSVPTIQGWIVQ